MKPYLIRLWSIVLLGVTMALPLTIPHSALLVGLSLMALAVAVRVRAYIRGRF